MKKLLILALVSIMCLSLIACGGEDTAETKAGATGEVAATGDVATGDVATDAATDAATEAEEDDTYTNPADYTEYTFGALKFAVPTDWLFETNELMATAYAPNYLDSVIVASEEYTDLYKNMTNDSFMEDMGNEMVDYGATIESYEVDELETARGLNVKAICVIAYFGDTAEPATQLTYVVEADDMNYIVLLTLESGEDLELAANLANSLYIG